MEESFTERFSTYSDEKLMDVLLHHEQYKQEAIEAVVLLLKKRSKLGDAQQLLLGKKESLERAEEEKRIVAQEQVDRLQTIDFGKYFSFLSGSSAQFWFQDQLFQAEIPFQISEGFDYTRPVVKYHVPETDFDHATWLYGRATEEETTEEAKEDEKLPYSNYTGISVYWVLGLLILTAIIVIMGSYLSMPN